MIGDRSPPMNLLALVPPQLRRTDPVLATIDQVVEDDARFCAVKADLARRAPHSATRGRPSTPVEVILRMLVVRRLDAGSDEETGAWVADRLSLRQCCRLGTHSIPDDTTLLRWSTCLRPATIEQRHARVVQLARERGVTRGRKLRIDGTVVATTIHYPSASSLVAAAGRMVGRVVPRAHARSGDQAPASLFRTWTRSTKRLAQQIGEAARKRGEAAGAERSRCYRRLLGIVGIVQRQGRAGCEQLAAAGEAGQRLRRELEELLPRVEQVVQQTRRRLAGEQVPAAEKLVSLVEPQTAIIKRDKPGQQTEFGPKVLLAEAEGGISRQSQVLAGNGAESAQVVAQVDRHRDQLGRVPPGVAMDRGGYAPGTEEVLRTRGVTRVVIPVPGKPPPERQTVERSRWFRQGQRFRAGIEGRISGCKRRGWIGRCRDHGEEGFERWIGWGVIANNLVALARHEAKQSQERAA